VLKKGGEAVELKNFDFTSQIYTDNPERSVARILKQVESRARLPGVNKVTVTFSSLAGKMPADFGKLLSAELGVLEGLLRSQGKLGKLPALTFNFWP
jgi:hypothetical protein